MVTIQFSDIFGNVDTTITRFEINNGDVEKLYNSIRRRTSQRGGKITILGNNMNIWWETVNQEQATIMFNDKYGPMGWQESAILTRRYALRLLKYLLEREAA